MTKPTKMKRARDAITGRTVSLEYAEEHPATTVVETVEQERDESGQFVAPEAEKSDD